MNIQNGLRWHESILKNISCLCSFKMGELQYHENRSSVTELNESRWRNSMFYQACLLKTILKKLCKQFKIFMNFSNKWTRQLRWSAPIKGTQAWESSEYFLCPTSKPYMTLANIRKRVRLFSFYFSQNFDVRTFLRWLSIRRTNFLLWGMCKFFNNLVLQALKAIRI